MSEEYYKIDAINSGTLADFYKWEKNIREEPVDKYEYWLGKCFEGVVREKYDKGYTLPFFPIENLNKRIVQALIDGSSLDEIVRVNKDGSVRKSDQDIAEQIEIIKAEERAPIDQKDFDLIQKTVGNLMTMEVMDGLTVADFLEHAEFDKTVVWEDEYGNKFKALFDIVSTLETDGNQLISVALDLKYYANEYGFSTMFKSKLWVQERHYTEALKHYCIEKFSSPYFCMPFLVGYKDSGLTQVNIIEEDFIDRAEQRYYDLRQRYIEWINSGKKETGHLTKRYLKVY